MLTLPDVETDEVKVTETDCDVVADRVTELDADEELEAQTEADDETVEETESGAVAEPDTDDDKEIIALSDGDEDMDAEALAEITADEVTESVLETVFTTVHDAVELILELFVSDGDALTHADTVAHELAVEVADVETLKLTLGDSEPVTDVEPDALLRDEPEDEGDIEVVDDVVKETEADDDTLSELLPVEVTAPDGDVNPEIEGELVDVEHMDTDEDTVRDELGDELMDTEAVELEDKDKALVPVSETDALELIAAD